MKDYEQFSVMKTCDGIDADALVRKWNSVNLDQMYSLYDWRAFPSLVDAEKWGADVCLWENDCRDGLPVVGVKKLNKEDA